MAWEKSTALTLEIMQNEYIFKMEMGKHKSEKVLAHYLILLSCCLCTGVEMRGDIHCTSSNGLTCTGMGN